jgi:hypothetical protein
MGVLRQFSQAIQRAFGLLQGHAWNRLQVDHGRFDVAVPQQPLDGLEVVIGDEQMTCVGVTKRMWRNSLRNAGPSCRLFDGALNMGLVQVVAPPLSRLSNPGQSGCREEPLPDELPAGVFVFLLELPGQEDASVVGGKVLSVQASDEVHLLAAFRECARRQWHRAVLLAFAIVDRQQHRVQVEAVDPQPQAS